jgi:hypothetical protein
MYFPLRKYMTGPRAATLPGQRPREPAVASFGWMTTAQAYQDAPRLNRSLCLPA